MYTTIKLKTNYVLEWAIPENIQPYHGRLLGFPKGRGGVLDYGILRACGVFTIVNPKAWVNSTGGISGVENVERVP